jgi:hypothetical protein
MYDYMVEELLKDNSFKLVRNILQELKKENFSIFDKNNKLLEFGLLPIQQNQQAQESAQQ